MNKEDFLANLATHFDSELSDGDETLDKFKDVVIQLDELCTHVRIMTSNIMRNNTSLPYSALLDIQKLMSAERRMGNVLSNKFGIDEETIWHIKPDLFEDMYPTEEG